MRQRHLQAREARNEARRQPRPRGAAQDEDRASYVCTFRGADTATFVKLTFKFVYKED